MSQEDLKLSLLAAPDYEEKATSKSLLVHNESEEFKQIIGLQLDLVAKELSRKSIDETKLLQGDKVVEYDM